MKKTILTTLALTASLSLTTLADPNAGKTKTPTTQATEKTTKLFNGKDLKGWHADIPKADKNPNLKPSFIVRAGNLVSLGRPLGHLITDATYNDYKLVVEYRFSATNDKDEIKTGNCGVLVHASKPRALYGMFPASIEVQMHHQNAGDFWCIAENIEVPNMETRRPKRENQNYGGGAKDARNIKNLTDTSEKKPGEWNTMIIECNKDKIDVWVNGDHVNNGFNCTSTKGQIALQAEGAEVEFRKVELTPLPTKK